MLAGVWMEQHGDARSFQVVILERKASRITLKETWRNLSSFEELNDKLPLACPVCLVVDGKGILHKKITAKQSENGQGIGAVIPNLDQNGFYIQSYRSGNHLFYSLGRRAMMDEILAEAALSGITVIRLVMGVYETELFLDMMSQPKESLHTGYRTLVFENDGLSDYLSEENPDDADLQIAGMKLARPLLPAYASALCMMMKTGDDHFPEFPRYEKTGVAFHEVRDRSMFRNLLKGSLALVFLLLIVNYVIFSIQYDRNQELKDRYEMVNATFSRNDFKGNKQNDLKDFLVQNQWSLSPVKTYQADMLARSVPTAVQLTRMDINPMEEQGSKEKMYPVFDLKKIVLEGRCPEPVSLNEWVNTVKKSVWVEAAQVISYSYDKQEQTGKFKVVIQTK